MGRAALPVLSLFPAGLLEDSPELWVGVSAENEPELPRRRLGSVA